MERSTFPNKLPPFTFMVDLGFSLRLAFNLLYTRARLSEVSFSDEVYRNVFMAFDK